MFDYQRVNMDSTFITFRYSLWLKHPKVQNRTHSASSHWKDSSCAQSCEPQLHSTHGSNSISKAEREYQLSSIHFKLNPDIFRWLDPAISTVRGFDLMPRLRQKALLPSFRSSLSARSPGFRSVLCWFPFSQFVYGGFCDCCRFCFVWFDHSNPQDDTTDDTMLSSYLKWPTSRTDQLITLPSLFCLSCCFWFGFCLFVVFLLWLVLF